MNRALAAAVICTASTASARPWTAGMAETVGYGGTAGELSFRYRLESGGFLRVGPWQLTLSVPSYLAVTSTDPARDSDQLVGVALASRLAYHVALEHHGDAYVAAGIAHEWLFGDQPVIRPCRLTGACIAGYTMETPGYEGWMPEVRAGIGPHAEFPDGMIGASFELIVDAHRLDVPPHGLHDVSVLAAITMTVGWRPKPRHARDQNL